MTLLVASEHFAGPPHWTWYILFYFFLAGLAGRAYFLATLLRYWGSPGPEPVARLGFYVPFPATIIGLLLLTLDLKQPLRFWHMLFNTTPGQFGLSFNSRTPMSVGVWALLVASVFSFLVFVDTLVRDGRLRIRPARAVAALLDGTLGLVWNVAGAILYLFIAGYTALLLLLTHYRAGTASSRGVLERSEGLFTALELLLVVVVVVTLIDDGTLGDAFGFPWILLWLVALVGMLPGLASLAGDRIRMTRRGPVAAAERV